MLDPICLFCIKRDTNGIISASKMQTRSWSLSNSIPAQKSRPGVSRRGCDSLRDFSFADCETDCPHAAFKHKNVTAETPARESVEVRALVFTYTQ